MIGKQAASRADRAALTGQGFGFGAPTSFAIFTAASQRGDLAMGSATNFATSVIRRWARIAVCVWAAALFGAPESFGQEAAEQEAALTDPAQLLSPEELRVVVAPVAFYPDDVLAVVLPASTTGIQVVEAERFLEKHKTDPSLQPDEDWDPSVSALINYPDVVALLNADLDWTQKLGDAVLDQQGDVMDTIQQIRAEAVSAGYLKSDEKQVITQEKETVVIQSADPEVVYVPQYDPAVVVQQTYATYPPPVYYDPYPPYYAPGATFFAGAVTGAAFAFAFDWDDDDIDIDFDGNGWGGNDIDINTGDINFNDIDVKNKFDGDRVRTRDGDKVKWNGDKNRKKRDRTAEKRRDQTPGVAKANRPGRDGAGTRDRARQDTTGNRGQGQRAGERDTKQRDRSGLAGYDNGRKSVKESKRGNKSLQGGASSAKKQKRSSGDSGAAMQTRKKQGGHGSAFNGSRGGGKKAGAQKSRGQKSMGGKSRPRKR
jgi:hypothetical protein